MESLSSSSTTTSYETISINNTTNNRYPINLLFVLEQEFKNSLLPMPQYLVARSSLADDPRYTNDHIEIKEQDIVSILNTNTDYELVKLNTIFYVINNTTDVLGWQYTKLSSEKLLISGDILNEEKDEGLNVNQWSASCQECNLRRRLWVLQITFPLEREEIQSAHVELNDSFTSSLLLTNESIELKLQEQENTLSDYESGSIEIYYRYIKVILDGNQYEHTFHISNHTRISVFHDSIRPHSIKVSDKDYSIVIAMKQLIDTRNVFSILNHIVDIQRSRNDMTSSTFLKYQNPTSGPTSKFPLLYSEILVMSETGNPKNYSLRLFSHRIELYRKGVKLQEHTLFGGRLLDKGKLEFNLVFEYSNEKNITIHFKCLNFKSKRLWVDTISQTININNRIERERESFEKEFLRLLDHWGSVDEKFQHEVVDIINIRQTKCRQEAEDDLLDLILIQRQDTNVSSEMGQRNTRQSKSNCCTIL